MSDYGVLGENTDYQFEYKPDLLFAIPRYSGRELLGIQDKLPFYGIDSWTAYELSWLNVQGLPQVAIAELDFSCASPNIIESKSLKLYLNSFNQSVFPDMDAVRQAIARDLSTTCGMQVVVRLFLLGDYVAVPASDYVCIDDLDVSCRNYLPEPGLLKTGTEITSQKLCSHLFRSLCPVTGQPDWASIFIVYSGNNILLDSLLQYLVSYRNHQGFHEQCVEQIFCDIQHYCRPRQLCVYARFLRRGGLDINPLRSSEERYLSVDNREVRQ